MTSLRKIREIKKIQRKHVAKYLDISPDHLSMIERGETKLDIERIEKLSILYNIPIGAMTIIALDTYKNKKNIIDTKYVGSIVDIVENCR